MRIVISIVTLAFLWSCGNNEATYRAVQGEAFGTSYSIQYYATSEFDAQRGIDSVVQAVNSSVSTYMPNSDISLINQGDATVVVDSIFIDVFQLSDEIYRKTDGYFDPTVGVLRNAYGFGESAPLRKLDSTVVDSLLRYVGFQKVRLTENNTVEKKFPEIYFDFNAIAKGYGIDKIGAYLEKKGVTNYLIELGGELLAKGTHVAKQKPWTVGIEAIDSRLDDRSYEAVIPLRNQAMASSGNYRKFRVDSLTGKKYVHTLNPLTGSAEQSNITSATVLAPTCAMADAYATAFMALGLEKSKVILETLTNVEAYLTYNDTQGTATVFVSPGFKKLL
ncbi:MAG: thiamine biosynthesis protein ApbE [Flavobacteriaceae bacterium]|nr:thiamine biosynthesis protein ApbE [Flavobacteriaceae bacterium]